MRNPLLVVVFWGRAGRVADEDAACFWRTSERMALGWSWRSRAIASWRRKSCLRLMTPRVICSVPGGRMASPGMAKPSGLVTSARKAARLRERCALASCRLRKCVGGLGLGGMIGQSWGHYAGFVNC